MHRERIKSIPRETALPDFINIILPNSCAFKEIPGKNSITQRMMTSHFNTFGLIYGLFSLYKLVRTYKSRDSMNFAT